MRTYIVPNGTALYVLIFTVFFSFFFSSLFCRAASNIPSKAWPLLTHRHTLDESYKYIRSTWKWRSFRFVSKHFDPNARISVGVRNGRKRMKDGAVAMRCNPIHVEYGNAEPRSVCGRCKWKQIYCNKPRSTTYSSGAQTETHTHIHIPNVISKLQRPMF